MIQEGDDAPDFTAQDQDGEVVSLSDFAGQRVVLYFYPKDDTPGCTTEACSLRDNREALQDADVAVVGVSADTVASHAAFRDKHDLNFPLIADPDREIIEAYGVGGSRGLADRVTFLIDENGVVEHVFRDVDPEHHAEQVLEVL